MAAFSRADGDLADELYELVRELYPICRSITGDGVRATLRILDKVAPMEIQEVPSGTSVLDWTVPPEWNIREAFIEDPSGRRVIDFAECNLHVVSYSVPVDETISLDALRPHLHTLVDRPDVIPYRTSYYDEDWGFCLSQRQMDALAPGDYRVRIDSSLQPGSLTYGEIVIPGELGDEILISTHVCHPSLCDDNLSGIAVSVFLARQLMSQRPRHTFRFLFGPGTIGSITWLARNRATASRVRHGLTLTCLGDAQPFTYKKTVAGNALIDRASAHALTSHGATNNLIEFFPYGYDERQFNSPGFRLPVGSLMRGRHGQFPEYHTSADNLEFVSGPHMAESFDVLASILEIVDGDRVLRNLQPFGEPQLGRRGLYAAMGGRDVADAQLAMLWILNLSDGRQSLLDIAERSHIDFPTIAATAALLEEHQLLDEVAVSAATPPVQIGDDRADRYR